MKGFIYKMSHWEAWDWRLKYIPLVPAWLWQSIRCGSLWFFSPSNPALVLRGYDGVSKKDMYARLPLKSYPKSIFIDKDKSYKEVASAVAAAGLAYPVAVKPEVGRMGFMFRKIECEAELKNYHERMPYSYIVQEFVDLPMEVSVFYYRLPGANKGVITGFVKKESMEVVGDGKHTLWELIASAPSARLHAEELKIKHQRILSEVLKVDEAFKLSHALNLSRGGKLVSLENEKDERLLKVFDDLCDYSKGFDYGRYDIKCSSVEDLKEGKNFSILEYNGSGGEPHHVYGNGYSLWQACSILATHWSILYKISMGNSKKGNPFWKFREGWKFFRQANKHVQHLKKLDAEYPA